MRDVANENYELAQRALQLAQTTNRTMLETLWILEWMAWRMLPKTSYPPDDIQ